jgi:hypothetical protein
LFLILALGPRGVAWAGLLDGLQLHIEFENNVADSSPNSFDGQITGDLEYSPGVIGQAANFDGVADRVTFPTFLDTLITHNDFSIAFWFDLPAGDLLSVLGKREICSVHPFFDIRMNHARSMGFELSDSVAAIAVTTPATAEGWHHVTFTRSGTNLRAYLDGRFVAQTTTPAVFDLSNTEEFGLSTSPCTGADGTQMLVGRLDDLRIYNRLLTDAEIFELVGGLFADNFDSGNTSNWSKKAQ